MDFSGLAVISQILAVVMAIVRLSEFASKYAFKKNPQFRT
jgi:hypothetical protein